MFSRRDRMIKLGYGEQEKHTAIALGYDPEKDMAPRVLASGAGVIAEQILSIAKAQGIPVREDPVLAGALANVEVNQVIPPELYALVAEVLAYVYRIQHRRFPS